MSSLFTAHHFLAWVLNAGFCLALVAFRLLRFSCLVFYFLIAVLWLWGGANPLCFIFCFISLIVLLVHYFTTLTLMGRVHSLLSPFCIFCRFVFLWDRLSVCPFHRSMFILFVFLVRFSFMFT